MTAPRHIAIILDGNGRWARARHMTREKGHAAGIKALDRILAHAFRCGAEVVSVFALSTENLKRPQAEVNHILNLLRDYIGSYRERAENEGIRVRVMGDLTALPADIREAAARTIAQTAHGTRGTFNIGINYGSRDELCAACNALIKEGKPVVTPADLEAHLYTDGLPPLDLLIRPGGCVRLSNFMLFQAAYAELYFCDTLWPDFSEQDLDTAFAAFAARERRFGVRPEKRSKI